MFRPAVIGLNHRQVAKFPKCSHPNLESSARRLTNDVQHYFANYTFLFLDLTEC